MGRRALVLLVALILAGVAAFSVYMFVDNIAEEERKNTEQVVVFRATQPIPEGQDGDLFHDHILDALQDAAESKKKRSR